MAVNSNTIIPTNQSTVTGWLWTNERSPLWPAVCLLPAELPAALQTGHVVVRGGVEVVAWRKYFSENPRKYFSRPTHRGRQPPPPHRARTLSRGSLDWPAVTISQSVRDRLEDSQPDLSRFTICCYASSLTAPFPAHFLPFALSLWHEGGFHAQKKFITGTLTQSRHSLIHPKPHYLGLWVT